MIQDIEPYVYSNAYRPEPPEKGSFALIYRGKEALVSGGERAFCFPRFAELEALDDQLYESYTYLFSIDAQRFYLVDRIAPEKLPAFHWENTQFFRTAKPRHLAFAGITGFQLHNWYKHHRFCGRCGKGTRQDEKERMLRCVSCGNMEYPKISPAIIVGVTHGNRLLLSKYANREYKRYALLAGFAEIGETIEQTIRREVMEEVGLKVKNLRYYKSQPWSFTDTLLMGFFAELDGEEEITLDREELALAEWFDRADILPTDANISLTSEMILRFKNGDFPEC